MQVTRSALLSVVSGASAIVHMRRKCNDTNAISQGSCGDAFVLRLRRLDTQPGVGGKSMLKHVLYASPVGAYIFAKLCTTVLKLDAEHLKSYYKGQVHMRANAMT